MFSIVFPEATRHAFKVNWIGKGAHYKNSAVLKQLNIEAVLFDFPQSMCVKWTSCSLTRLSK